MYNVSESYKMAVSNNNRKSKMRATLQLGSNTINLNDSDIIKDSVYVTNQCTNGNEYEYGCVYSAECGITIKSALDRYNLYDCELKLYWSLYNGVEWEEIPLGVFYISEPNRINDKISIKALDGMTKLDVSVDEDTQGTMVELLHYIAEKCDIILAQTDEELAEFVNYNVQYSVFADTVDTYRDLLAYICMLSASFATFDRFGKLKIVKYSTEKCVSLGKKQRFTNATFSDYTTKFVGIKARFIAEENYAPYEEGETGNGLVLDMGDIPILRGLSETKHAVLQAVFEVLKEVSYTPFELETLGNPALELGDIIENTSVGSDANTYVSPITYYNWTYRGKQKLKAVGGNPKLAGANNKQGKQISSLESEIQSKNITVKNYSNAEALTINSNEVEIATFNYASTENSKLIFLMTIRLVMDLDGVFSIKFYNDGAEDKTRVFNKYLERGEHFITISELYTSETNERHTISIKAHMEYFESDKRKQDADISTYENFLSAIETNKPTVADNVVQFPTYNKGVIDTTVPTANIAMGGVNAILYGQGIAGEGKWDGTINFAEEVASALFGGLLNFENASDVVAVNTQEPTTSSVAENVNLFVFGGALSIDTRKIVDSTNMIEIIKDYVFSALDADKYTFDKYVTTNNNMFALKTIYNYESVEETIDIGKMCSVAIETSGITVESVVVTNG